MADKKGLISNRTKYYMMMEAMCYEYGMSPREFRQQEPLDIAVLYSCLKGRNPSQSDKSSGDIGNTGYRERKEWQKKLM